MAAMAVPSAFASGLNTSRNRETRTGRPTSVLEVSIQRASSLGLSRARVRAQRVEFHSRQTPVRKNPKEPAQSTISRAIQWDGITEASKGQSIVFPIVVTEMEHSRAGLS